MEWKRMWWNGNIEFEIEDGKGTVIEYDDYSNFIFIGEYINGERNGNGKEYNMIN